MRRSDSYFNFEILKEFCFRTINSFTIFIFRFKNSLITMILFWKRSFFSLKNRTPLCGKLFLNIRFPKSLSFVIMIRKSRFAISSITLSDIPLQSSYTEITSCPNDFKKFATCEPVHSSTMNFINDSSRKSRWLLQINKMDCIGNTSLNIISRKIFVFIHNFFKSCSIRNQIQDEGYRNTGSLDYWFSSKDLWTAMNSDFPTVFNTFHKNIEIIFFSLVNHFSTLKNPQGANPWNSPKKSKKLSNP